MHIGPLRAPAAELLGTALLLWAIVGSGIAVTHDGPLIAQLFPHAVAVGLALAAIIVMLAPISGAHLNPAVTLAAVLLGHLPRARAASYVVAQVVGGAIGVMIANLTFGLPAVALSVNGRDGIPLIASEAAVTAVLVLLIFLMVRAGRSSGAIAVSVGAFIAAALLFTSSTAFANPAVTLARMLSDTFTGIAPASAPGFLGGQLVGALSAVALVRWFTAPGTRRDEEPSRRV
jgi:glycerol uptake facilitator-like aquaporin